MKKLIMALTAASMMLPGTAMARYHHHHYYGRDGYRTTETVTVYDTRGRYIHPHRLSREDRVWRGRDGQYYCRRDNGSTGLVIGAGVGALLGNQLSRGSGDRTLGTIIGAVGGGLIGQSVDRGDIECR